jgi:hypothetical protein
MDLDLDLDPDPGGPKTYGSGSATLEKTGGYDGIKLTTNAHTTMVFSSHTHHHTPEGEMNGRFLTLGIGDELLAVRLHGQSQRRWSGSQ